jgi:hypothetical protein
MGTLDKSQTLELFAQSFWNQAQDLPDSAQTFEARTKSVRHNPGCEYLFDCEIRHLSQTAWSPRLALLDYLLAPIVLTIVRSDQSDNLDCIVTKRTLIFSNQWGNYDLLMFSAAT